ncbi:hypothetical protein EXIGLDRAFT_766278 [Exidia glandulosa HHB12029]|uniref:F-box domain-containing protein n=1 Tax=Exidia glandulosa HHB12029 TaxID=1314781 RepID=A0A165JUV1_EXIGL|nr:hypothetical protein EXIGLDRAFT_766278 [Exidia glandulosa HHB12029]
MSAPHHDLEQQFPRTTETAGDGLSDAHDSGSPQFSMRLPVELVSRVLLFFVSHVDEQKGPRAQRSFFVTSICRTWRQIMLSSSCHWPMLYLDIHRGRGLASAAEYVDTILERSRGRRLRVRLTAPFSIDYERMATLEQLIPRIISYAGELEIQQCDMPAANSDDARAFDNSIIKFLVLPTPLLHSLSIVYEDIASAPFSLLPFAPHLQSLKLVWYGLHNFCPDVVQNLRAIMLSLADPTPATIISLSANAPLLAHMDLRDFITEDENSTLDDLAKVSPFTHLRTLHLTSIASLSHFPTGVFPVLTTLELSMFEDDEEVPVEHYRLPSLPLVRTLRLSCDHPVSQSDLWRNVLFLLLHFPHIERLDLHSPGDTRAFWPRLLAPSVPSLRQLQTLVIAGSAFEGGCGVGEFVKFLETRHHLRRLELRKTSFPSWMESLLLLNVPSVLIE